MNKNLLKEYIQQLVLSEYKTQFNINYFKNLKTSKERYDYASSNLKLLGRGSSRAAFLLPNTKYVLKLALPARGDEASGIAQNEAEVGMFTTPGVKDIITKIYDYSPEYFWLISEAVRAISGSEEFKTKTGFTINELNSFIMSIGDKRVKSIEEFFDKEKNVINNDIENYELYKPKYMDKEEEDMFNSSLNKLKDELNYYEELSNNKYLVGIDHLLSIGHYPGDLAYSDHWGITVNGNLVLLDYGASNEVIGKYY